MATLAGLTLAQREATVTIVASAALGALTQMLTGDDGNAFAVAATTIGIGVMMIGFSRLIRANEDLREARDDLARLAVAEERLRFARDLHDLLGHSLSVIVLKAELAGRLLPDDPARAAGQIADTREVARAALGEVRDAVERLPAARRSRASSQAPAPRSRRPASRPSSTTWRLRCRRMPRRCSPGRCARERPT